MLWRTDVKAAPSFPGEGKVPVSIEPTFLTPDRADRWLRWCRRRLPWEQDRVKMFGREILCRRQVALLGVPHVPYRYGGRKRVPAALPRPLQALLVGVNEALGTAFDSVLATRYRYGEDRLGWHADNEPELGPEPELAILSLGATRDLALRLRPASHRGISRRKGAAGPPGPARHYRLALTAGSLLHMHAGAQTDWQHAVPPCRGAGERISLGLRRLEWA